MRITAYHIITLLAALLIPWTVGANGCRKQTTPSATAALHGVVRDAGTQAAIGGAVVTVRGTRYGQLPIRRVSTCCPACRSGQLQPWPPPTGTTSQMRVVETAGLRHEYSRFDPFNKNQTLILVMDITRGQWRIYRTQSLPYDTPANLAGMSSDNYPSSSTTIRSPDSAAVVVVVGFFLFAPFSFFVTACEFL